MKRPAAPTLRSDLARACDAAWAAPRAASWPRRGLCASTLAGWLLLAGLPSSAGANSVEVGVNAWLGGFSSDWLDPRNWELGVPGLINLPFPILPTAIGPVRQIVDGVPVGYHLPQREAVIGTAFATPSFTMYAWDGLSQLRLTTGALLTASSATIGQIASEYSPIGAVQAATVVLDGGQTAGNWTFLSNSRVVVNGQYAQGQGNWSGTLGQLELSSGSSFLLNSGLTVNSLINNSNGLVVNAGTTLRAAGAMVNNGTLTLSGNSSQGNSTLSLDANTLLSGSGTTLLGSDGGSYTGQIDAGSYQLTIASGQTVRGVGSISGSVANQGTVRADGAMSFNVGSGKVFDNSAGVVQLADGASLRLDSGALSGGALQSLGNGRLSGSGVFKDLSLSGNFEVTAGGMATVAGVITNLGQLTLSGNGNQGNSTLYLDADTTLAGNGSTWLTSGGSVTYGGRISTGSHTLTVGETQTLRGSGTLAGSFINRGTVLADGYLSLSLYNGSGAVFDNSAGLLQVSEGTTLNADSGTLIGGTVQSLGNGKLTGGATFKDLVLQGSFSASGGGSFTGVTIAGSLAVVPGGNIQAGGVLTNNGTLSIGGNGNQGSASLYLNADTLLAGNGTTLLSSANGYGGNLSTGSQVLTIGAAQTVRGSGMLAGSFVNQGKAIADGSLTLSLWNGNPTSFNNNAGLVQISDGATLTVESGTFTGGTLQSLGSGKLAGNATFKDVALSGNFNASGGGIYTGVTLAGSLAVTPGNNIQLSGVLTNNGTLAIGGNGSQGSALLYLAADTLLAGNGTTVLSSANGYGGHLNTSGQVLTIGGAQTVRGSGSLAGTFVNLGKTIADGSLTVSLWNGNPTSFDNNAGLVQISDGATLTVESGTFTGGTLQSMGSGMLAGNATFKDVALSGNFNASGGGIYTGVTLAGSLAVTPGSNIQLSGVLTNNGTLAIGGNGNQGSASLSLAADTLLAGSGTTVLSTSNGYAGNINTGAHVLTLGEAQTVRGSGNLAGTFVNRGTLIADGSLALSLYNGSSTTFDNSQGLVQLNAGSTLTVSSGTLAGGTVQGVGSGGTLTGDALFQNLTLSGTLKASGGTYSGVTIADSLTVAAGGTISTTGTLTNKGSLTLNGNANSGNATLNLVADTVLAGTGTTWLKTTSGYSGLINTGSYTLTIAHGATLGGAGTLNGNFVEHGTLAPGDGIGKLTLNGSLALGDDALLAIDAAGLTQGSLYDWLAINGDTSLDGSVQLNFGSYVAKLGDSFTFLTFSGTRSGSFDAVSAEGYQLSLSYADHAVTATVTAITPVPEPGAWALMLSGLLAVGGLARRRARAAVHG